MHLKLPRPAGPPMALVLAALLLAAGCGSDGDAGTAADPGDSAAEPAPPEDAGETAPPPPPPAAARPEIPDPPAVEPDSIAKARAIVERSFAVYREAGALTDTVETLTLLPGSETRTTVEVRCGSGDHAELRSRGWRYVSLDGVMYVERDDVAERFLGVKLRGTIPRTVAEIGSASQFPPHFELRAADATSLVDAVLGELLDEPELAGWREAEDEGRTWDEALVTDRRGWALIRFDPETDLMTSVTFIGYPPNAPAGAQVRYHMTFDTKVIDSLAEPITFAPGDRTGVPTFDALGLGVAQAGSGAVGMKEYGKVRITSPFPEIALERLDADPLRLTSRRGRVIVLHFWATWSDDSLAGLPDLQEFADWVDETNFPVDVYAVNFMERGPADERSRRAKSRWRESGLTVETLLDSDDRLRDVLALPTVPVTLVLGPRGTVDGIHVGRDTQMVRNLQTATMTAMARGN